MKTNIFQLMEREIWVSISKRLQRFLVRLSLIEHLSVDFIALLAENDKELIAELEKLNAYVRRDNYINAYLIHPLFLEFIAEKQNIISEGQRRKTYAIAGHWCGKHGFLIDALSYYEKIGNYDLIVSILLSLPQQIPRDIANYASIILDRDRSRRSIPLSILRLCICQPICTRDFWKNLFALPNATKPDF